MAGLYPDERARLAAELAVRPWPELFDHRLGGFLLHELTHGLARPVERSGSWMVREAAAALLGELAYSRHVIPREPGEAVPSLRQFALLGDALAHRFGLEAVLGFSVGAQTFGQAFGPWAAVFSAAEWQSFEGRFAPDARHVPQWIALVQGNLPLGYTGDPSDRQRAPVLSSRTPRPPEVTLPGHHRRLDGQHRAVDVPRPAITSEPVGRFPSPPQTFAMHLAWPIRPLVSPTSERTLRQEHLIPFPELPHRLTQRDPVFAMGSCFADAVVRRLGWAGFLVDESPFGVVYDPLSVARQLERLEGGVGPTAEELLAHDGHYQGFDWHYLRSGTDPEATLSGMQGFFSHGQHALAHAKVLIITLGSAVVWRHHVHGDVANNHGFPAREFSARRLSPAEIVRALQPRIASFLDRGPDRTVWLTVSPVRHQRLGALENTRSKAALHLALSDLVGERVFEVPAYHLVMDELRDHHWFEEDGAHPNARAHDYVFQAVLEHLVAAPDAERARRILAARAEAQRPMRRPMRDAPRLDAALASLTDLEELPGVAGLVAHLRHTRDALGVPVAAAVQDEAPVEVAELPALETAAILDALSPWLDADAAIERVASLREQIVGREAPSDEWRQVLEAVVAKHEEWAVEDLERLAAQVLVAWAPVADGAAFAEVLMTHGPTGQLGDPHPWALPPEAKAAVVAKMVDALPLTPSRRPSFRERYLRGVLDALR